MLRALGRSDRLAQSSLRLSLGRFTTAGRHRAGRAGDPCRGRAAARRGAAGARRMSPDDPRYGARGAPADGGARRCRRPAAGRLTCVRARAGDREQGAEVVLALRVADGRAAELRFRAFGCPHFLAAASWLTDRLRGAGRAGFARLGLARGRHGARGAARQVRAAAGPAGCSARTGAELAGPRTVYRVEFRAT